MRPAVLPVLPCPISRISSATSSHHPVPSRYKIASILSEDLSKSLPIPKSPLTAFDRPGLKPHSRARHKCWQKSPGLFQRTHTHSLSLCLSLTDRHHSLTPQPPQKKSHGPFTQSADFVLCSWWQKVRVHFASASFAPAAVSTLAGNEWVDGRMDAMSWLHRLSDPGSATLSQFRAWPCAARVGPSCQSLILCLLITEVSTLVQFSVFLYMILITPAWFQS